jgi:amino acid adenylation domain-containing protein
MDKLDVMNDIEGYKLSAQQQRIWSLQKQAGTTFLAKISISFKGKLDVNLLKTSLNKLVEDHEIFSTHFAMVNGFAYPLQVLNEKASFNWRVEDLSGQVNAQSIIDKQYHASNDVELSSNILVSATLFIITEDSYVLLFEAPALLADNQTLSNLYEQLVALYSGKAASNESVQYIDYSEWQAESYDAESKGALYWIDSIDESLTACVLPSEIKVSDESEANIVTHSFMLEKDLLSSSLVSESSLLSCWVSLLHRICGNDNIIIDQTLNQRISNEFDFGMGAYANLVPLKVSLSSDTHFQQVVSIVDELIKNALLYQLDLPKIESTNDSIGFEFVEISSDYQMAETAFSISNQKANLQANKLKLTCIKRIKGLIFELSYDSNKFSECFIKSLISSLIGMLKNLSSDCAIDEIPLLHGDQKSQLLEGFNKTEVAYPSNKRFHQLFEQQALKTPNNVAVKCSGQSYSYKELNERSNQLAHKLIEQGIEAESIIAIYMSRSIELMVALLAVFKSGGSYVAIDPATPSSRFMTMLEGVSSILTQSELLDNLSDVSPSSKVLCLDKNNTHFSDFSKVNPSQFVATEQVAYVLYTSGSTGTPKGVKVTHKGLMNYLTFSQKTYLGEAVGALVHTSIAFDLTVTCLYVPLMAGKFVELVSDESGINGLKQALLEQQEKTLLKITPSHLKALNPWFESSSSEHLKQPILIVGGESLSVEDLSICFKRWPELSVFNEYGPTEATVGCCVYKVQATDQGLLAIGTPIQNTSLYVLDKAGNPVPSWVAGELYIGGDGLATGYLNRDDITRERFVKNPFNQEPGAKLYKTGDLVRFRTGSKPVLEFLGRNDRQVKVRSYRIELDDVENVIKATPEVKNAIVTSDNNRFGEVEIVAYVVAEDSLSKDKLTNLLMKQLPEYMIPQQLFLVEDIPLTVNGKADLKKLARLYVNNWQSQRAYIAPETNEEKILAHSWQQALSINSVGIHDNFFELGGDSIRGVHTVAIAKEAGLEFSMQDLFQAPNIKELAVKCKENRIRLEQSETNELDKLLSEIENMSDEDAALQLEQLQMEETV